MDIEFVDKNKMSVKLVKEEITKCPVCGSDKMKVSVYYYDMPKIGPVYFLVGKCMECGYKFVDVYTAESKGPQRIEFKVEKPDDLNALVLRSARARIEIPELQAELAPGPYSKGFITTVEGVLRRFEDIINFLCQGAENEISKRECEERKKILKEMLEGKRPFRLIIEDPEGHSKVAR